MTLPASVTITRNKHALEGRAFRLLGTLHRHGHEELLIILEDGTKSLVPASWTDHVGAAAVSAAAATLGTLADLLAASVLARTPFPGREAAEVQAARKPPSKGDDHAACAAESAHRSRSRASAADAGPSLRGGRRGGDPDPGGAHRQGLEDRRPRRDERGEHR